MKELKVAIAKAISNLNKIQKLEERSGYGYLNVKPMIRDLENFNQQCYELIPEGTDANNVESHSCPKCGHKLSVVIG